MHRVFQRFLQMVVFKAVYSVFYAYPTSWQGGFYCSYLPAELGGSGEFERFEEIWGNLEKYERK